MMTAARNSKNDHRHGGSARFFQKQAIAIVLGGHAQGLGIVRSLGRMGVGVVLVDETAACIGRHSKYCRRFFRVPEMKQERGLLDFLTELAKREPFNGAVIFPTHDATVEILSKNRERLGADFRITVPDWSATEYAHNKILTHRLAEKTGVPVARTLFPRNVAEVRRIGAKIEYPVIVKPAVMHTFYSRFKTKVFKAHSPRELAMLYEKACEAIDPAEVMIQEIIPGSARDLFSCGCFFNAGILQASCIGQRCRQIPMDFGKATTFVKSVEIPLLRSYSERLLSVMNYYGMAEVEFMRDPRDGSFKLLEINPRSWKWHTLAIRAGLDLPYLVFSDLMGRPVGNILKGNLDVKWVELISDFYIAVGEMLKGNLSLREYADSFRGTCEFAIASKDDPKPFLSYLLMLPYLFFAR